MTFGEMILLSLIQGIGEFLPISSSGHIVLFKKFIFNNQDSVFLSNGGLEVFLHISSMLAILVFFRKEIRLILSEIISGKDFTSFRNIILATIPTGIIGIIIKKSNLDIFNSLWLVVINLMITGIVLIVASNAGKSDVKTISAWQSLGVGILQGIAVLPGISRSGLTISGGLLMGIDRKIAASFSFLILLPALCGAVILEFKELATVQLDLMMVLSFVFTFLFGLIALKMLFGILDSRKFRYFGYYCCAVSIAGICLMYR